MGNAFKIIGIFGIIVLVIVVIRFGVPIIDLRSDDPVVTLVKFDQLRNGMTYEEIVEIVGEEGAAVSDSSPEAEQDGDTRTLVFEWKNGDLSGMKISFKDGKLIEKSQTELE
jgi:hypothetical protein